jgi:O-antigen/teichoic acid export membrane protein
LLPIFKEAIPFVMIGLGYMATRGLDVIVLTRFSSIPEVSRYGAALNFIELLSMLAVLVQRALLPAFSRLKFTDTASNLASNSLALISAVLVPACTGLALLADSMVQLYPSREYDAAAPALMVLSGCLVFLGPSIVCATFLTGAGRVRVIIKAYAVAAPIQAGLSLALVNDHAAVGVAAATVLGHAVLAALLLRASMVLGMRIAYRVILRQILSAALMALVVAATRELPIIVTVIAGCLIYAGALWTIAPRESPERRVVADVASHWRRR